jgi:hypothetical protein
MGGYNSGGGRLAQKTDDFLDVDLASLKRLGMLREGYRGMLSWHRRGNEIGSIGVKVHDQSIDLHFRHKPYGEDWRSVEQTIWLDTTPAGFGGTRYWFLCPRCSRRCRILYGGALFVCRKCRALVYESQYEPFFYSSHKRIERLRRRLGNTDGDSWDLPPEKPKGMHWKTYGKLVTGIYSEQAKMDSALRRWLGFKGYLNRIPRS